MNHEKLSPVVPEYDPGGQSMQEKAPTDRRHGHHDLSYFYSIKIFKNDANKTDASECRRVTHSRINTVPHV